VQFEHLVEVNDLANAELRPLSREELWFGLLCRAEDARPFLPGLEACNILARSEGRLERELVFGHASIRDTVTFSHARWIRFESEATASHAGGSLTISIDEPQPGALFLRFRYQTTLREAASSEEARYADIVRSAYHQSDIDTLKVIRMITESTREQ
jgi:hypothetical protein